MARHRSENEVSKDAIFCDRAVAYDVNNVDILPALVFLALDPMPVQVGEEAVDVGRAGRVAVPFAGVVAQERLVGQVCGSLCRSKLVSGFCLVSRHEGTVGRTSRTCLRWLMKYCWRCLYRSAPMRFAPPAITASLVSPGARRVACSWAEVYALRVPAELDPSVSLMPPEFMRLEVQ